MIIYEFYFEIEFKVHIVAYQLLLCMFVFNTSLKLEFLHKNLANIWYVCTVYL